LGSKLAKWAIKLKSSPDTSLKGAIFPSFQFIFMYLKEKFWEPSSDLSSMSSQTRFVSDFAAASAAALDMFA